MTFFLASNHQDIVWRLVFERGVNFAPRPIPTLIVIDSFERGHLNTQSIAICTRFPRTLEFTYIFVIDISLSLITFIYYTSFREIFLDLIEIVDETEGEIYYFVIRITITLLVFLIVIRFVWFWWNTDWNERFSFRMEIFVN